LIIWLVAYFLLGHPVYRQRWQLLTVGDYQKFTLDLQPCHPWRQVAAWG